MPSNWTVIGFTGHRLLSDPELAADTIRSVLNRLSADCRPLAAVSSAASGADTLFLEEVARRDLLQKQWKETWQPLFYNLRSDPNGTKIWVV